MKTIWKFVLSPQGLQTIEMPAGAKLLYVREQNNDICIWAEVDRYSWKEDRTFEVFGTGHERYDADSVEAERTYLGSAHLQGGALVLHVYERKS